MARAVEDGGERASNAEDGGTVVRQIARVPARRQLREARRVERPRGSEGGQRLRTPAGPGPRETEVGERDVDEMRVTFADLGRGEAVRALLVGTEVLDQDVGVRAEVAEAPPAARVVQIDDCPPLAGVPEEEGQRAVKGRYVAGEGRAEPAGVQAQRLDLDHVGAQVGEDTTRQSASQVDHLDDTEVSERGGHAAPLLRG